MCYLNAGLILVENSTEGPICDMSHVFQHSCITRRFLFRMGARGSAVGWGTELQAERSWVPFPIVSLEFFIDIKSFHPHYGPGVDSTSNRNEYQEYFLGVKAAGA